MSHPTPPNMTPVLGHLLCARLFILPSQQEHELGEIHSHLTKEETEDTLAMACQTQVWWAFH